MNPPQSCILAVGSSVDTVLPDANSASGFKVEPIMKIVLSCDHRSVDGAVGASFMKVLKSTLENPLEMLL
ncbi:MAG: 2-oxo acid dehydrogenase subunit E2 [Nostocaceae cyanobacterium]|nr:2-oxo acid dehydrogenase subunit E2 [Nostocaceae cyanobacterium]